MEKIERWRFQWPIRRFRDERVLQLTNELLYLIAIATNGAVVFNLYGWWILLKQLTVFRKFAEINLKLKKQLVKSLMWNIALYGSEVKKCDKMNYGICIVVPETCAAYQLDWISNYNRANDVAGWQPTPTTADVTITKIAGYVRVRILMNRGFFSRNFGIHSFYATVTLVTEPGNEHVADWSSWRWLWGQIWLCTHACNTLRRPVWRKHSKLIASREPPEGRC